MKFIDEDRTKHIELIQEFCRSDEQNGRILLLSGPRGVGKTRLIDEALTPYKQPLLSKIGINACSRPRHKVVRGPRGSKRILLKVNVDAYFPFGSEKSQEGPHLRGKSPERDNSDKNRNAILLLRNIIFALTSSIDPRFGWRTYGRTLAMRLGFLDFWLFRPATVLSNKCYWALQIVCSVALMVGISFLQFKPIFFGCVFWDFMTTAMIATFAIGIIFLLLRLLLRLHDWRALAEISHQLYDLAHAQEVEDTDENLAQQYDAAIHPQHKRSLSAWIWLALGVAGSFYLQHYSPLPASDSSQWFLSWLMKTAPLASVAVGATIFAFNISLNNAKNSHVARYGNKNPAWIVTLLRRYLYIAHRCGIEPVLVFDELDKLEASFGANLNDVTEDDNRQISPRLRAFLGALLRLRDSSGAGFLTVLVAGPRLHYKLRQERLRSLQLSVSMIQTGTLIQQECCVGLISYIAAQKYFQEKNNGELDTEYCAYFWLQAHGMSGNYMRLLEQYVSGSNTGSNRGIGKQQLTKAENLAIELAADWDLEHAWRVLQFRDGKDDILNHRLADEFWYRCFIRIGMVQYCAALLEGLDAPKSLHYQDAETTLKNKLADQGFTDAIPKIALVAGSPDMLRLLGQHLIFKRLQAEKKICLVLGNKEGPIRLS